MSHALVVGGTGMLWDVSMYLAEKYDMVSVIARNSYRLNSLWEEASENDLRINPLQLDYKDEEHVEQCIKDAIEQHGPIDLVVAWIHEEADEASATIADVLEKQGQPFKYFDIWGFIASSDNETETEREDDLQETKNLIYRKIVLGFVIEDDQSRWLTNEEISEGVIQAIEKDQPLHVVGSVSPLSAKP